MLHERGAAGAQQHGAAHVLLPGVRGRRRRAGRRQEAWDQQVPTSGVHLRGYVNLLLTPSQAYIKLGIYFTPVTRLLYYLGA